MEGEGEVWRRTFSFEEMCRWESWRAPERANMRGMKSSFVVVMGVVVVVLVDGEDGVERGCVGMRQDRGASLWM